MKYVETEWYEMKPYIYGGYKFNEHIPQWSGIILGDEGEETSLQTLPFDPKDYPPGTKIVISQPLCPKCQSIYENCMSRDGDNPCDFDWRKWAEEQFS